MKTLTLSVLQFNNYIKNILDAEDFLTNIAIFGEVTNFKISAGNAYFDLKDESAMLSCVKFGASDLDIKNGDLVTVFGKVNFYVKSGRLNFIVGRVAASGLGELYQKFMELKAKLEQQGYFRQEIKKQIPKFSKRIGVVTSETGAVIRDIIRVTRTKNPYTDLIVYPAKVQGANAEDDIVSGIKYFNGRSDIDVIIVARGGGSLEDLSPFNTEKVVYAIFDSVLPVISAVGHETDFTLCDFASDLRVPTPSVAAEVAVFDFFEQVQTISEIAKNNYYYITRLLENKRKIFGYETSSIIDRLKIKLGESRAQVFENIKAIERKVSSIFERKSSDLNLTLGIINKLNPLEILKSGYSVIEKDGKKIFSKQNLKLDDEISVTLSDGSVKAKITDLKGEKV